MPLTIEDASLRHLDRLYEIERQCFKEEAFSKQQIASLLTEYNSICLIAKENAEIVAFVIGTVYFERNALSGHILTIDVSPKHRREGIGEKLLHAIEQIFKERGARRSRLEVREDNTAALNLYETSGYRRIGKLKNYYGKAHGIYLEKSLT